jgi:hypothetical protein
MTENSKNLTGVWHGLYSYQAYREPVYFVATLIDGGSFISGSTHESEIGETGAPLTLFASIDGSRSGNAIDFIKSYDGSAGWSHSVTYEGLLNADATEIEGTWVVVKSETGAKASGKFLMIRSRGATETVVRHAFEKA